MFDKLKQPSWLPPFPPSQSFFSFCGRYRFAYTVQQPAGEWEMGMESITMTTTCHNNKTQLVATHMKCYALSRHCAEIACHMTMHFKALGRNNLQQLQYLVCCHTYKVFCTSKALCRNNLPQQQNLACYHTYKLGLLVCVTKRKECMYNVL